MNKAALISFILALSAASPATAQNFLSAGQLLDMCADQGRPDCYQYLSGAHDAIIASQETILMSHRIVSESSADAAKLRNFLIRTDELSCIPQGTTVETLRRSFVQWMINNDSNQFGAGRILAAAFSKSFPCPN